MIQFLPQVLQDIEVFTNRVLTLFSSRDCDLDIIDLGSITNLWICLSIHVPNILCCLQEHAGITSSIIEFHSHDIVIELASSEASNFWSPRFGPFPRRWLNLSFSSERLKQIETTSSSFFHSTNNLVEYSANLWLKLC